MHLVAAVAQAQTGAVATPQHVDLLLNDGAYAEAPCPNWKSTINK